MNGMAVLCIMALMIGTATAATTVTTNLVGTGTTSYSQQLQAGGADWQKVGDVSTGAWITPTTDAVDLTSVEQLTNTGSIEIIKTLEIPSTWNVRETRTIVGSGATEYVSDIAWKTNTRAVLPSGSLQYPTVMKIKSTYLDANVYVNEDVENTALTTFSGFGKNFNTDQLFNFGFQFGKNLNLV